MKSKRKSIKLDTRILDKIKDYIDLALKRTPYIGMVFENNFNHMGSKA